MLSAISCSNIEDRDLGDGYFLTGYGITTTIYKNKTAKEDSIILLGEIDKYKFDDTYILVHRSVSEQVIRHFNNFTRPEILRGGDSSQYWIINKVSDSMIGPLNIEGYRYTRSQLHIENDINSN